jgi:hypothetical protein
MSFLDQNHTGIMFLHAIEIKLLNGRDGRFSTGRSTANPYRNRAVEVEGK